MKFCCLRERPSWWECPFPLQRLGRKYKFINESHLSCRFPVLFCKCRWSPTISAKSSVTLTGLRRSVTLSNSSNSAVGKCFADAPPPLQIPSAGVCWFSFNLFYYSSKLAASFQSMEVRNSNFAAFIDVFTSNTYVMVIMSDPSIRK